MDYYALRRNDLADILDDGGKQSAGGFGEEVVEVVGSARKPRSAVWSKNSIISCILSHRGRT